MEWIGVIVFFASIGLYLERKFKELNEKIDELESKILELEE